MITIKTYNIIDLFSGAGGLSLGFKQTGKINIVAAAENNPNARKTYKRNFAEVKRLYPDVRTIDYNELKEAVGQVDIVIGGPPCQGFSNANRQHSTIISMNNRLVKEYVRAICELQPTAFVMENVAMLKSQVHRFFLEENDMTNAKILNLPLREDNIEILPQNMNFEGSRELILSAPNGVQYAWAETFYKTINLLYRYRINQPKFDLSLTKYEKKLVPQLQELFRGFNGTESSNRIQQKDSFMAIQILNYIENKEKREESFDRVIQAIRDSLLIQRALLKVKELSDNNIHVFDYVEKDGGLYATVKSYSVLDYLQGILENEPYNYTLKCDTLNAISFGAPQRRERFIMVGLKKDLNIEYCECFEFESSWMSIVEPSIQRILANFTSKRFDRRSLEHLNTGIRNANDLAVVVRWKIPFWRQIKHHAPPYLKVKRGDFSASVLLNFRFASLTSISIA